MILHFSVNYHTRPGQNLFVSGTLPLLGGGDDSAAAAMVFLDGFNWRTDLVLNPADGALDAGGITFEYRYLVRDADGFAFYEAGYRRKMTLTPGISELWLNDQWQGYTDQAPLLTAPFSEVLYPRGAHRASVAHQHARDLTVRVTVPAVSAGECVCLCGAQETIGWWSPARALRMTPVQGSRWEVHIDRTRLGSWMQFKFIKAGPGGSVVWESGEDRRIEIPELNDGDTWSVEYAAAAFPEVRPRIKGTAVPLFSLRSESSEGIGDCLDLKLLCDWAAATGQHIIQLLPINDTTSTHTWTDSYPYSGISVMALHPLYLNLGGLGPLKDRKAAEAFETERRALNALPDVDYEAVLRFKERYWTLHFDQDGERTMKSPDYRAFFKCNESWLRPYALFCALRDRFGTADFTRWGAFARYDRAYLDDPDSLGEDVRRSMDITCFLQYHADRQLRSAVAYAHEKKIALKGDIPIGITPHSVEAWTMPELFHSDVCAGAPPDFFSADGQNWGFPTYDWDAMARDGFAWWKARFSKMSDYFDAYRIDHVLGFFRIWEIPGGGVSGRMGHFAPALPMTPEEIRDRGFRFDEDRHAKPYGGEDPMEVLFVEDPRQKGCWHPVISARATASYRDLDDGQRRAYDAIYDDFFYRRHNEFWKKKAYIKLSELIASTRMLTCAEDLGMIPDCVPEVMSSLRILTLEIQRMPKGWGRRFSDPKSHPYLSVCTTGSHDISPLRGWWEEDRDGAAAYWHDVLHRRDPVPEHLGPDVCEEMIRLNLDSSSMLTIIPIQDYLGMDPALCSTVPSSERINDPANPRHYWRYRMPVTLERLCGEERFNEKLSEMIGI